MLCEIAYVMIHIFITMNTRIDEQDGENMKLMYSERNLNLQV